MNHFRTQDLTTKYLQASKLELFLSEIEQANRKFNLFSRKLTHDDLKVLAAEALIPVELGWITENSGPIVDIGSGWGIPAVPLLLSGLDLHLTLLERSQKKADFLFLLLRRLQLDAEVITGEIKNIESEKDYAMVTIRGVAINEKLRRDLKSVVMPNADFIYFGPSLGPNLFESVHSVAYKIDNYPERNIFRVKII